MNNNMTNEDIEEYAKYKMRTITGENGVSKYEMLSFDAWLWNNKPYENLEDENIGGYLLNSIKPK